MVGPGKGSGGQAELAPLRLGLSELGGALGDLGTFVPLAVALITLNGLNATAVLLVVGGLYVAAALYYRIPMPVQPLKAASAIAIALHAPPSLLAAAALWMGVIVGFIGISGGATLLDRLFTRPLVRGIQLGVGLLLVKTAVAMVGRSELSVAGFGGMVQWGLAAAVMAILAFGGSLRVPAPVVVVVAGALLGAVTGGDSPKLRAMAAGSAPLALGLPTLAELGRALPLLVIPQLPLTLANSIVATRDVARRYFGAGARRVTARALAMSVGSANLVAGVLGGMPVCHGSAGLTAHFRTGARTGGATLALGLALVALGIGAGDSAAAVLGFLPLPVLGGMLAFVGVQHASLVGDLTGDRPALVVAVVTGVGGLAAANLTVGLAAGIGVSALQAFVRYLRARRPGGALAGDERGGAAAPASRRQEGKDR